MEIPGGGPSGLHSLFKVSIGASVSLRHMNKYLVPIVSKHKLLVAAQWLVLVATYA